VIRNRHLVLHIAILIAGAVGCGSTQTADREPSIDVPAVAGSSSPASPAADQPGVNSATPSADPARAFSTPDIEFLATMLSHHTGAQPMVKLAERRATTPEVRAFASTLRAAQQPEIDQMGGWLASLGIDPATAGGGHDHGGGTSQQDVGDLEELTGPAFDRKFLGLLTDHTISASALAGTEASAGFNSGVRQLAMSIGQREWDDMRTIRRLADAAGCSSKLTRCPLS
jgi:uncharacterized protein (DUF305 family)